MIYSKYLKYKNKYLKLKQLHGGLYNEYQPKKVEVDMDLLKSFFKGTKFSEQDKIRDKFNDYYYNFSYSIKEEHKNKILDNLFSLDKDLFCVFINILNRCATKEDQLKCYLAIERLKLNLIGDNYKSHIQSYEPNKLSSVDVRQVAIKNFLKYQDNKFGSGSYVYLNSDEIIEKISEMIYIEFNILLDQLFSIDPKLYNVFKNFLITKQENELKSFKNILESK